MSQRVKKPGKVDENNGKRRRRRPSGSDIEEEGTRSGSNSGGLCPLFPFSTMGGMWTPKHLNDLKVSSIYNRNSAEAPAELYRKDLISAMKLADSEPLTPEEYWLITDPWKQEWEKGVQVPVNPESLPEPEVVVISPVNERSHDFRLPKKKLIRVTHDDFFNPDYHQLVSTAARAEKVCSYDLDDIDASWLQCANADRGMQSSPVISEFLMEQVIEELELQCWEQVQTILKSQEGLGIEYDENVICDVCRSPESEEGNEMVFCDSCNICVHQACYGITTIPSGSWLCRTCTLGIRPTCVLCPNVGGAMKATRSGQKWAHVACAIWIPEVSIGSVEKMEPITKISAIPQSRWSLICVICKEKGGACIQCSVKTCKTAYHVTCAFKNGLEMKPIIVDENAEDGIKLRSYCQKHSVNTKKEKSAHSGSETEDVEKKKQRAMTAEERNHARAEKLQQIEAEFYKYVRLKDVAQNLAVDMDIVMLVYNYWKLKRKSLNNRPLVPPRPETTQLLTQQQEQDLEQMKMFVQLRQDLERVRNLCYMVSRREKLSRTYFKLREQTFQKQVALIGEKPMDSLTAEEKSAIQEANRGPSIYDQIYSFGGSSVMKDYDTLVSLIAGEDRKEKLVNGVIKRKKSGGVKGGATANSFKKQFVNGARKKNLIGECSSLSESEASANETSAVNPLKRLGSNIAGRKPLSYLFDSDSSMDGAEKQRKKSGKEMKGKRGPRKGQKGGKKSSTSDSDELEMLVPNTSSGINSSGKAEVPIYSDSDSEGTVKRRLASPIATKAAVKAFSKKGVNKKDEGATVVGLKCLPVKQRRVSKKKGADHPELFVPQREAAKKASESIRCVKPKGANGEPSASDQLGFPVTHSERDSESYEKSAFEKFKDIAAASVQEKLKKRGDRKRGETKRTNSKKSIKIENIIKEEPDVRLSSDLRNQYEFDDSNDSKNVPNFVPQRQAAKKAAEHIRSGLSNIVAARLIIEDEMEATSRKKGKGEKVLLPKKPKSLGKTPLVAGQLEDSSQPVDESGPKSRARKRTISKEDPKGTAKGGRKESATSAEIPASGRQTDWPFLDRGSQSACRRSRERSTSSSSSSSRDSSSSDSSSSSRSSASSSTASASPESNEAPRKAFALTKPNTTTQPSATTTRRGPSRKLKTSDRSPSSGPRSQIVTGKKPTPKSRGPGKFRSRGAAVSSSNAQSAKISKPKSDSGSDNESNNQQSKVSGGRSVSQSPSPINKLARVRNLTTEANNQLAKEKGKRGKRERSGNKEKETIFQPEVTSSGLSKSPAKFQTGSPTKEIVDMSRLRGELALSSDSEPEGASMQTKGEHLPTTSADPQSSKSTRRKGVHLLSDSDNDLAEEKENSMRSSDAHVNEGSRSKPGKSGSTPSMTTILSPLTPSSDNKEKEHVCRLSEAEPDAKRARLESTGTSETQPGPVTNAPLLSAKSLFSPEAGHENDLVDLDSELYDLTRSLGADYSQVDEEGGVAASSLPFFSQSFLAREVGTEDSPHATLNLVEKLRLQHARKSGCPRSSMDGSDVSTSEDLQKSPVAHSRLNQEKSGDSDTQSSALLVDKRTNSGDVDMVIATSLLPATNPEGNKMNEGDERWVPPSSMEQDFKQEHPSKDFTKRDSIDNVQNSEHQLSDMQQDSLSQIRLLESKSKVPSEQEKVEGALCIRISHSSPKLTALTLNTSPQGGKLPQSSNSSSVYCQVSSASGFPMGTSHSPFMYQLPGVPSAQSGSNPPTSIPVNSVSPRTAFFHSHSPPISQHSATSSLSPGYSRQNYPGAQHFLHGKPRSKESPISPSFSNSSLPIAQQKTAPFLDENSITSTMPPLSKPSIASPSIVLANNVKNITPQPPPQSTVAQIIENVVNNHANTTSTAQELLSVMMSLTSQPPASVPHRMTPTSEPFIAPLGVLGPLQSESNDTAAAGRGKRKLTQSSPAAFQETEVHSPLKLGSETPSGKSPRGKGKRATTPHAIKVEKLATTETSGLKQKGRGDKKGGTTAASPARAKPVTPRGRGRGKGKGKGMVATRKDLAGTVYDIDFDEFEENVDEKMDLRSLRERRKSNDVHTENKIPKNEPGRSPADHPRLGSFAEFKSKEKEERTPSSHKVLLASQTTPASEHTISIHQTPLSTPPVDMRTYGEPGGFVENNFKPDYGKKDSKIPDLSSIFANKTSLLQEIDELDETLNAISAAVVKSPEKASALQSSSISVALSSGTIRLHSGSAEVASTLISRDSSIGAMVDTDMKSTTDFSRNQLKVKIKGPFLDANYGSHTMGDASNSHFQQHYSSSFHSVGQSQMSTIPSNNTSNLRRMRKKELLRQYWNQDMNMDGSSCGPTHDAELSHSSMIHRSVITIPKAVASMAIILPSKDDYRESLGNEEPIITNSIGMSINPKGNAAEKRKRNRGIREMAALGILPCDTPRERRRDRPDGSASTNYSTELMSKKQRGKTNKKPMRSTFIPPTLVDSDHSTGDKKNSIVKTPNNSLQSASGTTSAVVTAVDHPTPKLKIKFGDLSKGSVSSVSTALVNHVQNDLSDKEGPSKKVKGRPPKKRGISEIASAAPPSMEDLKRESMKFREMVMQDFAVEERKEILQLHGRRSHKKRKKKGAANGEEEANADDDPQTSEVKVIADGSKTKLILRFGKGKANGSAKGDIKPKEEQDRDISMEDSGENDSGFTGSSEGSSASVSELASSAAKPDAPCLSEAVIVKTENSLDAPVPEVANSAVDLPSVSSCLPEKPISSTLRINSTLGNELAEDSKPQISIPESCGFQSDKIMPIRLKLSRCFEGYALKKKQENCAAVAGVSDVSSQPPKPSDSCEVR